MMSDLKSHDLTGLSCGSWSLCSVMGMRDVLGGGEAHMFKTLVFYLFFYFFTYLFFFLFFFLAQTSRRRPSLQSSAL